VICEICGHDRPAEVGLQLEDGEQGLYVCCCYDEAACDARFRAQLAQDRCALRVWEPPPPEDTDGMPF